MPDVPCIVCKSPLEITERQTCPPCLARTRSAIMEAVELYALLPDELEGRAGARKPMDPSWVHGSDDPMPGGDVLVLLAHGSTMWRSVEELDSVAGVLDRYANDWREYLGISVKLRLQDVSTSATFLLRAIDPMAKQHPAFNEFAADMIRLRDNLRRATRTNQPLERGVPCPYCNGRLVRRYLDPDPCTHPGAHNGYGCDQGGRRDDWLCSGDCAQTFTETEYRFAVWYWHDAHTTAAG